MSVSIDLRSALLTALGSNYAGAGKVAQNVVESGTEYPYVFFIRNSDHVERDLTGNPISRTIVYDLECVSDDIDESLDLAAAIKADFDGYSGIFGDSVVWQIEVTDHSDDYAARNIDEGLHVASLQFSIEQP